ncbi:hypothetical protein [Aeromonas caviae]|jgi:hypothetical protein|uniref:hypothetical protein n=1 Tax=Aeromonas caviae TaxID=648 RepID=UPI00385B5663
MLKISEREKALEFSLGSGVAKYYPLTGAYRITFENHGVFNLEMLCLDGVYFLRCTDRLIEDLLIHIFGIKNVVSVMVVKGMSVVDFNAFCLCIKQKISKI